MENDDCDLVREALGRTHRIGDFYDARRDSFVHGNILVKPLPPELITILKDTKSKTVYQFTNSTKEKLGVMQLSGEVSASVLCGMVKIEGSAKFMNEDLDSSNKVHCDFTQNLQTQIERVTLGQDGLAPFFNLNAIPRATTHVVLGIARGCNAVIDFSCKFKNNCSKNEIQGLLKGSLASGGILEEDAQSGEKADLKNALQTALDTGVQTIGPSGCISGKFEYKKNLSELFTDIDLKVFADIAPSHNYAPTTLKEGIEAIRKITKDLEYSANCSGVPIKYELVSVDEVRRQLGNEVNHSKAVFSTLSTRIIEKAKEVLFEAEEQLQRIQNFHELIANQKIGKKPLQEIVEYRNKCTTLSIELREDMGDHLILCRGDKSKLQTLLKLFNDFESSPLSTPNMDEFLEKHNDLALFSDFMNNLKKHGVSIIQTKREFWNMKYVATMHVLFFTMKDIATDGKTWHETWQTFLSICRREKNQERIFAAVNMDILPELAEEEGIKSGCRIVLIRNREYLTKNLLGPAQQIKNWAVPSCDASNHDVDHSSLVPALLPCPHICDKIDSIPLLWNCTDCSMILLLDEGEFLYCGCGRRKINAFKTFVCHKEYHEDAPVVIDVSHVLGENRYRYPHRTHKTMLDEASEMQHTICQLSNFEFRIDKAIVSLTSKGAPTITFLRWFNNRFVKTQLHHKNQNWLILLLTFEKTVVLNNDVYSLIENTLSKEPGHKMSRAIVRRMEVFGKVAHWDALYKLICACGVLELELHDDYKIPERIVRYLIHHKLHRLSVCCDVYWNLNLMGKIPELIIRGCSVNQSMLCEIIETWKTSQRVKWQFQCEITDLTFLDSMEKKCLKPYKKKEEKGDIKRWEINGVSVLKDNTARTITFSYIELSELDVESCFTRFRELK